MKTRIRKILSLISSRNFLAAFAFSFALWLYITLNTEFVTFVSLPLTINLPPSRAIESELPKTVSVEVKGTGWQIFNLEFLNRSARCNIDLSRDNIDDSLFVLSRNDILKNLSDLKNVQVIDVLPNTMEIRSGKVGEFSVVVEPNVEIIPRKGYMIVGSIKVVPELINVKGNLNILSGLTKWMTTYRKFQEATEDINTTIKLSDSLRNVIALSTEEVRIRAKVRKLSEIEISDIKLEITDGDIPPNYNIMPIRVSAVLRGGIDDIEKLNTDEVRAVISMDEITSNQSGFAIPKIILPEEVQVLSIHPQYIQIHRVKRI